MSTPVSALQVLGKVSGLGDAETRRIFEEVKANHARLATCSAHEFTIDLTPAKLIGKRWQCTRCGGWVGCDAKRWYVLGRTHATLPAVTTPPPAVTPTACHDAPPPPPPIP